ncbi:MAG: hypothetical protein WEC59_06280 [Salibacteraceae bacterium]
MAGTKFKNWSLLFAAIPAFVYIVIRAVLLDFTFDEAWTFLAYAHLNVVDIIFDKNPVANNHILHSLLMRWAHLLFGMEEWALRIPVIASFVAFAGGVFALLKNQTLHVQLGIGLPLLYQPYLLDYFVAARGYALALAFMVWSICFLNRFYSVRKARFLTFTLLFGFLAAWANFTYLLLLVALIIALLFIVIKEQIRVGHLSQILGFTVFTGLLFYEPLQGLIEAEELYYGGRQGLFQDTFRSVGYSMFYHQVSSFAAGIIFASGIALSVLFLSKKLLKSRVWKVGFWSTYLLIAMLGGSYLQFVLFDRPLLIDRTAMFLIVLFLLSIMMWFQYLKSVILQKALSIILIIGALLNFISSANLSYILDFRDYADVKKAMKWVGEHHAQFPENFGLGKSVYLNAPINFYRIKYKIEEMKVSGIEYCDDDKYPVYYLFEKDLACVDGMSVDTVAFYPISKTYLLRSMDK